MILYPIIIYCTMYPVCCLVYFFKYHDLTINTVGHLELTIPAHPFYTPSQLIPSILPPYSRLLYFLPSHPFNTPSPLIPSILPPSSSLQILPPYSPLLYSLPSCSSPRYSLSTYFFNTSFLFIPPILPPYSSF